MTQIRGDAQWLWDHSRAMPSALGTLSSPP
jgi:hypothetical protein